MPRQWTLPAMAVTQADVDALVAKLATLNGMIADGVRSVTDGDQTVIYNTTDSLIRARDDVADQLKAAKAELASATSGTSVYRSRIMVLQQAARG